MYTSISVKVNYRRLGKYDFIWAEELLLMICVE